MFLFPKGGYIPLQALLNHTSIRLCETLEFPDDPNFADKYARQITLLWKWGCDGTSGQNEYHQLFESTTRFPSESNERNEPNMLQGGKEEYSEKHVFLFSVVPLRLVGQSDVGDRVIFWENPRPSSTRLCRPLKFLYVKETTAVTKREVQKVQDEIEELNPTEISINGK